MNDIKYIEKLKSICEFNYELSEDGFCKKISFYDDNNLLKNTIKKHPDKNKIIKIVASFPKLEHVNLRKSKLGFFPKFKSKHIKYLDVSCNDIQKIPDLDFNNLSFFNCGSNKIKKLPELKNFPLLILKAYKNPLEIIPELPETLITLNLFLSYNLKTIPNYICNLKELRHFTLSCFDLSRNDFYFEFKKIEWLSLSYCNIKFIKDLICNLENLCGLVLSKNKIKKLPDDIGSLVKLRNLSLYKNNLKSLPNSFFELNLKKLSLECNKLSEMDKNKALAKYRDIEIFKL
jgi:Leucine-rich repeat (LRR) protein